MTGNSYLIVFLAGHIASWMVFKFLLPRANCQGYIYAVAMPLSIAISCKPNYIKHDPCRMRKLDLYALGSELGQYHQPR